MYQLCIRNTDCSNEIIIYFELEEFQDMISVVTMMQSRSNEYLNYEIIFNK